MFLFCLICVLNDTYRTYFQQADCLVQWVMGEQIRLIKGPPPEIVECKKFAETAEVAALRRTVEHSPGCNERVYKSTLERKHAGN